MKYSYNKLWKLLIDKNMMKKDLMALTKINSSTIAKMGRGEAVRNCHETERSFGRMM